MMNEVPGFECLKELYIYMQKMMILKNFWYKCTTRQRVAEFHIHDGYLFRGNRLCIPGIFF